MVNIPWPWISKPGPNRQSCLYAVVPSLGHREHDLPHAAAREQQHDALVEVTTPASSSSHLFPLSSK